MRLTRNRKGQFIIIAAMLLSIMIVSVSTVIYGTVTYYRQERWEEYVTVVDSIRAASNNLLRVGLANYTQTLNPNVTRDFFNQWIRDVRSAYPAFGVDVGCVLGNGMHLAYGENIIYNLGLARSWGQPASYSASNATVSVDVASVGLTGYNFSSHLFLKMRILRATWNSTSQLVVYVSVDKEGPEQVVGLQASNFRLTGVNQTLTVKRYYSDTYKRFIYTLRASSVSSLPSSVEVTLTDSRSIKTVSRTTSIASS